jgi:arsenite/tail-anchored protein-transporting ATPase
LFDVAAAFDDLLQALELMQDKHRFAVASLTRRYREDAIDQFLDGLRARCQAAREALFAPGVSAFVLVARPEPMVLAETKRFAERLRQLGAPLAAVLLNAAPAGAAADVACLPLVRVPKLDRPPVGPAGLAPVAAALAPLLGGRAGRGRAAQPLPAGRGHTASGALAGRGRPAAAGEGRRLASPSAAGEGGIAALLEEPRRLTIFGGKGGVGKTTLAAATALALARRGRSVVVVSIDPAHSLGDSLGQQLGPEPRAIADGLAACELDPKREWQAFKEHWQAEGQQLFQGLPGAGRLDPVYDRQIAEQLGRIQPTGLDEIQAATAIIDLLDEDEARLVVVDSAPTGHLLRFLESPALVLDWTKELMRLLVKYGLAGQVRNLSEDLLELSRKTKRLEALLHDRAACEVVVVALAEAPVVAETERLIGRLEAMHVPVGRLVWNQADAAADWAAARCLQARHPDLRALRIARRPEAVQGQAALVELAA